MLEGEYYGEYLYLIWGQGAGWFRSGGFMATVAMGLRDDLGVELRICDLGIRLHTYLHK